MAEKFPSQTQEKQPGLEHQMEPKPSVTKEAYKPGQKLLGKMALITGGDSGIGRSVARHFALEGASVAFTFLPDHEHKDADETRRLIKEASVESAKEPMAIPADLSSEKACKDAVEQVIRSYGGIDILVNNAAQQTWHDTLEEITSEEWEKTFAVNIHSYFWSTKAALPYMKEGSCIINSTSINAYKGHPMLVPYSTTKGAIVAFTRSLALSLVKKGIRVNGVAPGPVWTPLIPATFPADQVKQFGSECPMQRAGQPDEIAPSFVFLASPDASFFSGQVLHPNGGAVVNA
jgi:NAD(P)-dependent dehydrogenase (short-subunit alcohol dehydrogenase family)